MNLLPKVVWISLLVAGFFLSLTPASTAQKAQIRRVAVVKSGDGLQVEIQTSQRVMPLTQVVTDPDRLIIDFSDTVPGPELRSLTVNKGAVKGVRIGRVTINPPVTRVVVDLTAPLPFQLFPSSKSVIVKLGEASTAVAAAPPPAEPAELPAPTPPPAHEPTLTIRPAASEAAPANLRPASVKRTAVPMPVAAPAAMSGITVTRWPVGSGNAQVKKVAVLKSGDATEIEIETSQRVEPAVQTVTGPDRLVIDFPQSLPGPQLRAISVNQGEVKGVRVGLLSSKPPVTRVVLDLKSAQVYQVFPSANSVIVKLPAAAGGTLAPSSAGITEAGPSAPPPPPKKVEIKLQDDKMSLVSNKASLAEVLNELHAQLNADIPIPAGAEQELVAVVLGPGTQREVISKLLEGSRYNFIIVGTDQDANKVERVILSPKTPGGVVAGAGGSMEDNVPVAQMQTPPQRSVGAPPPPPPPVTEDEQPQGDSMPPDTTPQPGDPPAPPN
jgi:AMIN domain